MSLSSALLILAAIIVVSTVAGVLITRRAATARRDGGTVDAAIVPAEARGERATLVQFSTEFCAQCPGVRRSLRAIAADRDGVTHVEIDLTHNAALAERLHILTTPTTFVLDAAGVIVSRFSGATPRSALDGELDRLLEATHV